MTCDGVEVRAERQNGVCVLRISGELDTMKADTLGERADAAVLGVPGPVLVDLSGLTFIDLHGARVLDAVIQTMPDGRQAAVRFCPRRIRRVLDLAGLSFSCPPSGHAVASEPAATALLDLARRTRLRAGNARLDVSGALACLADTYMRLANTIERAGLIQEQARQAVTAGRGAREQAARSRQAAQP